MLSFWIDQIPEKLPQLPRGGAEALRLDGTYSEAQPPPDSLDHWRGTRIRNRAPVSQASLDSVLAILAARATYGGDPLRCFMPRHGLRFFSEKMATDVVICFECKWIWFFQDRDRVTITLSK